MCFLCCVGVFNLMLCLVVLCKGCVLVLGVCAEQKGVDVGWMWVVLSGGIGECDVSVFVVEVCFMCCVAALL